jgi:superfamily II DNA or RNA helicase
VLDGIERGIIHDFSYVGAIYDTSGIREKYSDLSDEKLKGELDLALNNTPTMEEIFRKHLPQSKRKGIVFCTNIKAIDEAEVIMRKVLPDAEFRRMHSLMGAEVEEARKWFEGTDEGWLFAVNMISEGAHYKGVNTIVMFRRTESSLVFNQQLGRIITLARDEDPEAIVFDLVNNANNITKGKSFAGSLKRAYQQRKERGGKQKSEQVIVEDYAEKISDILRKISLPWTEEEDDFLKKHYSTKGLEYCSENLNKTISSVRNRVIYLDLIRDVKIKNNLSRKNVQRIDNNLTKPEVKQIENNLTKPIIRRIDK